MARIFSIHFTFNEVTYNGMVAVRVTPLYTEYTLSNLDVDLLPLLPGTKIISPTPENYLFQDASPQNSATLMNTIIKAVSRHLQSVHSC